MREGHSNGKGRYHSILSSVLERDQKLEKPVPGSGEGGEEEEAGGRTQSWQHQRPISFTSRFYGGSVLLPFT